VIQGCDGSTHTGDHHLTPVGFELGLEHFDNIRRVEYFLDLRVISVFQIFLSTVIQDMKADLEYLPSVRKLARLDDAYAHIQYHYRGDHPSSS